MVYSSRPVPQSVSLPWLQQSHYTVYVSLCLYHGYNIQSVHSAVNEYLAVDRDGNCTWITRGALKRVQGGI